jgi:chemotaxis protein histidine kinase CheA
VKKTTQVESSENGTVHADQVSNTVRNLSSLLSVNQEATVAPQTTPQMMAPAVALKREKRELAAKDSSESSMDFTNFCLADDTPQKVKKGKNSKNNPKAEKKPGTSAKAKAGKRPAVPKPKPAAAKGPSSVPEWRLRALKQRKMQQVEEIELRCTQLTEQFASNDTVLNLTVEKCETVATKLADLLDPASKTCMLPYFKDADGIFTPEGSQTEILSGYASSRVRFTCRSSRSASRFVDCS